MLFNKKFKVIEIHGEVRITHHLEGSRKAVNKDVEMFKNAAKDYEFIGKKGMVIWV